MNIEKEFGLLSFVNVQPVTNFRKYQKSIIIKYLNNYQHYSSSVIGSTT